MFLLLGTEHLPGTMRRRPLTAMMLMVKQIEGAGTTHNDPKVGTGDVLKKEVQGEKKEGINDLQQDHEQAESYVGWHTGRDVTGAFGWLG